MKNPAEKLPDLPLPAGRFAMKAGAGAAFCTQLTAPKPLFDPNFRYFLGFHSCPRLFSDKTAQLAEKPFWE
jgi:hypothetical protein